MNDIRGLRIVSNGIEYQIKGYFDTKKLVENKSYKWFSEFPKYKEEKDRDWIIIDNDFTPEIRPGYHSRPISWKAASFKTFKEAEEFIIKKLGEEGKNLLKEIWVTVVK